MDIQNKKLSNDVFFKERQEVLTQWPTGKDVDLEEAIAYHKAMPASRSFSKKLLEAKGAASVTIVTLLDKPARREKAVYPDLAGFTVPDEFVVGYGLDFNEGYRNLPYVGVLKPEAYTK